MTIAMLAACPVLMADVAAAQDTCRDTMFLMPCDYRARPPFDTSAIRTTGGGDTMAVPPGATAPMSGMSGIWDGAQLEVITSDPTWVGPPEEPGGRHGLAVDSRSRVYAVYYRSPSMVLYFRYKDLGQPWSAEISLPASPMGDPRAGVVIGPGDRPEFFYVEGGYYIPSFLVHATYDFVTGSWTSDTIAPSTRVDWPSWIRIDIGSDSSGGFHVVWSEPGWNDELHAWVEQVLYAENTTGSWRTHVVADLGGAPLLQVEPSGRALISYGVRRDGHNNKVFATNRFRGDTSWVADSVDTAPAVYGVADMRLTPDGTLHVLFGGTDCYSCMFIHRLFYTRRERGSRVFEPWQQLYDHAGGGRLLIDCAGHASVWYWWYDEEEKLPDMFFSSNASGAWVKRPFHFGDIPDWDAGEVSMILDGFDQGRAIVNQWMGSGHGVQLQYYAPPTVFFDVVDVVRVINHVYLGKPVCDPYSYDEDCSGAVDVADLEWLINYTFMNGPKGCRF